MHTRFFYQPGNKFNSIGNPEILVAPSGCFIFFANMLLTFYIAKQSNFVQLHTKVSLRHPYAQGTWKKVG